MQRNAKEQIYLWNTENSNIIYETIILFFKKLRLTIFNL